MNWQCIWIIEKMEPEHEKSLCFYLKGMNTFLIGLYATIMLNIWQNKKYTLIKIYYDYCVSNFTVFDIVHCVLLLDDIRKYIFNIIQKLGTL